MLALLCATHFRRDIRGEVTNGPFQFRDWISRRSQLAALALIALALGGCASTVADLPVVGLPAGVPARPAAQAEYLAVHDIPPPRTEKMMTPDEVAKAEQDLVSVRNKQSFATPKPPASALKKRSADAPKPSQSQN